MLTYWCIVKPFSVCGYVNIPSRLEQVTNKFLQIESIQSNAWNGIQIYCRLNERQTEENNLANWKYIKFKRKTIAFAVVVRISIEISIETVFKKRRDSSKQKKVDTIMDSTIINPHKGITNDVNNVERLGKRIYLNNFEMDIDNTHPHSH